MGQVLLFSLASAFNPTPLTATMVMLAILEIPLLAYTFAPDWTPKAMERLKEALNRNGQRILFMVALVMGLALIGRGVVEFLA